MTGTPDIITMSNLSGPEIIAEAEKTLNLTYLDADYAKYGFLRDERGKTYEVMVWTPGRVGAAGKEVRTYFKKRGFHGNAPAFIAWLTKHNPEGHHATIPEDDRLFRAATGCLRAPGFIHNNNNRKLFLGFEIRPPWYGSWSFVAFREIHS